MPSLILLYNYCYFISHGCRMRKDSICLVFSFSTLLLSNNFSSKVFLFSFCFFCFFLASLSHPFSQRSRVAAVLKLLQISLSRVILSQNAGQYSTAGTLPSSHCLNCCLNKLKMHSVQCHFINMLTGHWRGWFQLEKCNSNSLNCKMVSNSF